MSTTTTDAAFCLNCQAPLTGHYCAACGQAGHDGREPSIRHFLHDLAHEELHVDGKIFRTLQALLFKPGLLTSEAWAGHFGQWVRPIRVFLVIAALHLLASTGVGPLNFKVALMRDGTGDVRVNISNEPSRAAEALHARPLPAAEQAEFAEHFASVYEKIRYFSFVIFAAASWLLYRRQQPYYVNHLLAALHFYAFWYLLAIVAGEASRAWYRFNGLSLLVTVGYLLLALRHIYGQSWPNTLLRTTVMAVVLIGIELGLAQGAATLVEQRWGVPGPEEHASEPHAAVRQRADDAAPLPANAR